jgi:pimeloyl-ACP methyl ester carboxylesterase
MTEAGCVRLSRDSTHTVAYSVRRIVIYGILNIMNEMIRKKSPFKSHMWAVVAMLTIGFSTITINLSQGDAQMQTIERREVTIDLEGNRLQTQGELTLPAAGGGPFPAVLLIHGSGATDRDEYLPPLVTGTGNESRPFKQIADYLSERGFVVLRYDKRGIGENGTILNLDIYANATVQQFQRDAEAALNFLMRQPEVDNDRITILGHSEGAIIAPRIAIRHSNDVQNIVLMSASAQSIPDLVYYQVINRTLLFAHQYWDDDGDGSLSLDEVLAHPELPLTVPAAANIDTSSNGTATSGNSAAAPTSSHVTNSSSVSASNRTLATTTVPPQEWIPGLDANNDNKVDIDGELLAFGLASLAELESFPWFQSHTVLEPTIDIIDELTSTSILILQGEADIQTPVEHALVIEQRLTGLEHSDHTLITYPGLGHTFYPAEGPLQPLGPIESHVLSDLHSWLKDPDRFEEGR